MKKILLEQRKGWAFVPTEEILDSYAPIGAQIVRSAPVKTSAQSIQVAIYHAPQDSTAQQEAEKMEATLDMSIQEVTFQDQDAYLLEYECHGVTLVYIFLDVEDCVMMIRLEGTFKQVNDNWTWVNNHLSWDEDLEDNNGNPLHGESCLIPPAMLASMVSFTARDYEATQRYQPFLPDHFSFIVAASLTPALDEDDLLEKVEMDYTRHGGLHEINYNELSESTRERMSQYEYAYIGQTQSYNPFIGKLCNAHVAIMDDKAKFERSGYDLEHDVHELLEAIESDWCLL